MQYKNQRTTMLLRLELKTRSRGVEEDKLEQLENAKFDLEDTLNKIKAELATKGVILTKYRKDRLIVGLRKIDVVKEENKKTFIKLLWSVGDKDVVNPTYWNPTTDRTRVTEKGDEEALGHSCHLVISLEKIHTDAYMCSLERVPRMGINLLEGSLNSVFRKLAIKKIPLDEKNDIRCYPAVEVSIYPSETLAQTLEHGEITGIIMKSSKANKQDFDEVTAQTRISSSIRVRPLKNRISALSYLPFLIPAIKRGGKKLNADITDVTIQYVEENTKKSLSFECDNAIEKEDEINFNRTEKIQTEAEIPSFCEDFHEDLVVKMHRVLKEEQQKIKKKNARK